MLTFVYSNASLEDYNLEFIQIESHFLMYFIKDASSKCELYEQINLKIGCMLRKTSMISITR